MVRQLPPAQWASLERAVLAILLGLLALALSVPAAAMAAARSAVGVPNCAHFSSARMEDLIHTSFLEFEERNPVANICTYKTPHEAGHYASLFSVSVRATSRAVFQRAEHAADVGAAANPHQQFDFATRSESFWVYGTYLSAGLGPCPPEHSIPEFGPPLCGGEPDWGTYSFDTYARLRPRGPKAFVAVSLAGQDEAVNSGEVRSVAAEIVSGRIR